MFVKKHELVTTLKKKNENKFNRKIAFITLCPQEKEYNLYL